MTSTPLQSPSQICFQLHRALKMIVDPVEPQGDMKFQWDLNAWTKSAESFGEALGRGYTPGDTRAPLRHASPPLQAPSSQSGASPRHPSAPSYRPPAPVAPALLQVPCRYLQRGRGGRFFEGSRTHGCPPSNGHPPISLFQGPLQATVVSKGQYAPSPLLQPPMGPQIGAEEGQGTPDVPQSGGLGMPTLPQFPLGTEGLGCPELSPPHLYPQTAESPEDMAAVTELGEWGVTRGSRALVEREEEEEDEAGRKAPDVGFSQQPTAPLKLLSQERRGERGGNPLSLGICWPLSPCALGDGFGPPPPCSCPVSPHTRDPCHTVPRGDLDSAVRCHPLPGTSFPCHPHTRDPVPCHPMSRGWQGHPLTPYLGFPPPLSPRTQRWPQSPVSPVSPYPGMEDRGQGHRVPVHRPWVVGLHPRRSPSWEEPNFGAWEAAWGPPKVF